MMLHALVCDAPAKAFVLCTKGHPDFFCCSKCIVKGKHENRVCYPDIRQELRTDQSFRDKAQEEQHAGIPIDLIENVPLDYMQRLSWCYAQTTCSVVSGATTKPVDTCNQ